MLKLSLTTFIKCTLRAVQRKTTNSHFSFIHKLGTGKSEESQTMGRNDSSCKWNKRARGSNMTLLPFFRLKIQTEPGTNRLRKASTNIQQVAGIKVSQEF